MASRDITARLRVAGGVLFRGELDDASRRVDDLNRRTGRSGQTARKAGRDWDTLGRSVGSFSKSLLNLTLHGPLSPARVSALTLGASAVSSLGAAAVQTVSAIAPLSGALAALPAAGIAAASSMGVLKFAFGGLGDAIKALGDPSTSAADVAKALAGLSPQAVAFAGQAAAAQRQINGLRTTAQQALFPGLSAGLHAALPALLPLGRTAVTGIGGALGTGGRILGQTLASRGVRSDLSTLVGGNNRALSILTGGVAPGTQALARFGALLAPIETEIARMTVRGLQFVNVWTGQHKAGIEKFFEDGLHDAEKLGKGLGNIAVALHNVFSASSTVNGDPFQNFERLTDKLRVWTGSAAGQNSLVGFFTRAKPVIHETELLIRDVVVDLAQLGTNGQLAGIISSVRTELLPAINGLANGATGRFGQTLVTIVSDLARFANDISSGPLLDILGGVASFGSDILDTFNKLPGPLKTVISTLAGAGLIATKGKTILSHVPIVGGLLGGGSGTLGTKKNPMYVIVVGGDPGGGGGGGGGGKKGIVDSILGSGLVKYGKRAGVPAAITAGTLYGLNNLSGGGVMDIVHGKWGKIGPDALHRWGLGGNPQTLGVLGGALAESLALATRVTRNDLGDVSNANPLKMRPTHRTDLTALGRANPIVPLSQSLYGALLPTLAPPGSAAGAGVAGNAAAQSIANMLQAGMLPDLEKRIADAISKATINVSIDGKQVNAAVVNQQDKSAANR